MGKNCFHLTEETKGKTWEMIAACMALLLLLCSLIPLMYLGRYNHPTGDDFYYGVETHLMWEETGNIFKTMGAAWEGVTTEYFRWQGTYSAMFLMYLSPNIFGEGAYGFVTAVILTLLTGGIFYLLKPLVCSVANSSRSTWCIFSAVLSVLCIQTVPSQGETFFWYNGSMYYTGFLGITFFFWGIISRYLLKPKKWHPVAMWLLAIFLAGGNYVSLLPCLILLFCLIPILYYQKKKGPFLNITITFALMLLGLLISAAAPGNQIRQSEMWKIPAIHAILKSLLQGLNYVRAWIGIWWILAAIILLPFMWQSYRYVKYRFRWPLIVIGFTYGVFCSMSCPLFYTMNSTGPARAVSIVYYAFILSTFFCYYYFAGYVHRILTERQQRESSRLMNIAGKAAPMVLGCMGVLLLCIQIAAGAASTCSTAKAVKLLATGEAKAYHEEYMTRLEILQDASVTDVVFEPFENRPDMIYVGDLSGDPQDTTNQRAAEYYGKKSIYINY